MSGSNQDADEDEFEDLISATGFGWFNFGIFLTCGISTLTIYTDSLSVSYIIPAVHCDFDLTLAERSTLSSVNFIGIILSCMMWGSIADTFGRKNILIISMFGGFICSIASSIVPFAWLFTLLKFIDGFFMGCPFAVLAPYVGEFQGNAYRSKIISWLGVFMGLANLYIAGLAWAILSVDFAIPIPGLGIILRPWRVLVIGYAVPTLISACMIMCFPESPKYLWETGKRDEAMVILRKMNRINNNNNNTMNLEAKNYESTVKATNTLRPNISPKSMQRIIHQFKGVWDQLIVLYKKPLLSHSIKMPVLQFGFVLGANSIFIWTPQILEAITNIHIKDAYLCEAYTTMSHINETNLEIECNAAINENTFATTLVIGIFHSIFFLILGSIINLVGKKIILVAVLIITAIAAILLNVLNSYLPIAFSLGIYTVVGPCVSVLQNIVVDLYPTKNRGMAMAINQVFARLGSVTGNYMLGYLLEYACWITFYVYAALNFVYILLIWSLPYSWIPSNKIVPQ